MIHRSSLGLPIGERNGAEDVDRYTAAIGRLFIEAAPLSDTPAILRRVLDVLDNGGNDSPLRSGG